MPSVEPAQIKPNAKLRLYPAASSAGYMTEPIASKVTVEDPTIAENRPQDSAVATARPPGIGPTMARITRIRRLAMPPSAMIAPASKYSGIGSSTSWLSASQPSSTTLSRRPSPQTYQAKPATTNRTTNRYCRSSSSDTTAPPKMRPDIAPLIGPDPPLPR